MMEDSSPFDFYINGQSPEIIRQAHDIVFLEVVPGLDFDEAQGIGTRIFQAMVGLKREVDALIGEQNVGYSALLTQSEL